MFPFSFFPPHPQGYITLELQLGEVDRCRKLYAKYLEAAPYNCQVGDGRSAPAHLRLPFTHSPTHSFVHPQILPARFALPQAWKEFAGLEQGVGETERARAIFELAIAQPALDMPEVRGGG